MYFPKGKNYNRHLDIGHQCWFTVGPPSAMLAQHSTNIGGDLVCVNMKFNNDMQETPSLTYIYTGLTQ